MIKLALDLVVSISIMILLGPFLLVVLLIVYFQFHNPYIAGELIKMVRHLICIDQINDNRR